MEVLMSTLMKDLGIDRLDVDKRIELMQEIWDSVAAEPGCVHLSDAQRCELDRRLAEHEANPTDVVAWEQVKAEALRRIQP
jgi:putative addiction module component (TIGR02574 family)